VRLVNLHGGRRKKWRVGFTGSKPVFFLHICKKIACGIVSGNSTVSIVLPTKSHVTKPFVSVDYVELQESIWPVETFERPYTFDIVVRGVDLFA
jgi:hypothetical protein